MESVLCPLTSIDASGVDRVPLTVGYMLKSPVDPASIEAALSRVTLKWRLLAGRAEWDPKVSLCLQSSSQKVAEYLVRYLDG